MKYIGIATVLLLAVSPGDVVRGLHHRQFAAKRHVQSSQYVAQAGSAGDSGAGQLLPGTPVPHQATSLEDFILELQTVLEGNRVDMRPIKYLFSRADFLLSCRGDWMEFGVWKGGTINLAGQWRLDHCGRNALVHGFDTFTGLPEVWERGGDGNFRQGAFNLKGNMPDVVENVRLHKGLFADTLPDFIMASRAQLERTGQEDYGISYLHVDCDLYTGASQALLLNAPRMRPGMVLVFDDLINYAAYRKGEMKALWEWLSATGYHLRVVAVKPSTHPQANKTALTLDPPTDLGWHSQSVVFLVSE